MPDNLAVERLVAEALLLVSDEEKKKTLSANIKKLAERDADKRIAKEVMKLIKQ